MSRRDCASPERLSAFVLGKLPAPELTVVAEHLDVCPECDEQTAELDEMANAVVCELGQIPSSHPGTDHVETGPDAVLKPPSAAATESWGEFRIAREIGRGGMAVSTTDTTAFCICALILKSLAPRPSWEDAS